MPKKRNIGGSLLERVSQTVWLPANYDAVIDWIRDNNPFIQERSLEKREEFAVDAVNLCIRRVVDEPNGNSHCSTGMCMAVRVSMDPSDSGYRQVFLCITGLNHLRE